MKIVTSGVDSEYVLVDLCKYLRAVGYDVTELDFGQLTAQDEDLLAPFIGEDVVYITSAHTNLTRDVAKFLAPKFNEHYPNYLSPLEIIQKLKPKKSIYIPHDLLTPFGDKNLNELRFLDLFDYILTPFSSSALQATLGRHTKVIESGWIKHTKSARPSQPAQKNKPRIVLFISMFEHLRLRFGDSGIVDYFAPLITENVRVKLPAWRDVAQVEKLFNNRFPDCIIPAEECSIRAIQEADVVLCNGASSIHAESILMGRPTVCLLDDEGLPSDEQRSKLGHLQAILFHDYRQRAPLADEFVEQAMKYHSNFPSAHFDYGVVENIISK
ncbi:hypothetical protein [Aeromonas sp. 600886]|uniref:hypothetical protein n=1 Tax=Aeromonas sp. 600886 TaxID=2712033 RepID=UPI003BA23084